MYCFSLLFFTYYILYDIPIFNIKSLKCHTICINICMIIFTQNVSLSFAVPIIPDYLLELEQADNDVTSLVYFDSFLWNETFLNSSNFPPLFYNVTRLANTSHVTRAGFPIVPEQAAIINENSEVGWLFSSHAIVQLVANPFVGPLTNRLVRCLQRIKEIKNLCR